MLKMGFMERKSESLRERATYGGGDRWCGAFVRGRGRMMVEQRKEDGKIAAE
jgi:hypothetical protein